MRHVRISDARYLLDMVRVLNPIHEEDEELRPEVVRQVANVVVVSSELVEGVVRDLARAFPSVVSLELERCQCSHASGVRELRGIAGL